MGLATPGTGRAKIENLGHEMRITIPVKKRAFILFFLPVWLVGWAVGMVFVPLQLGKTTSSEQLIFMVVWLVGWTIGGAFTLLILLWTLVGREIIVATAQTLAVQKSLLSLRISRHYDRNLIARCRVVEGAETGSVMAGRSFTWGVGGGSIAFDYGLKTIKFGIFLEEAEARYIIGELTRHGYIRGEAGR